MVRDLPHPSMSHRFRTPLNAIMGFTGTLLMELPGPITADQEKHLRIIQSSARELLGLIGGLFDETCALSRAGVLSDHADIAEKQPESAREIKAGARILLIDDDPRCRKLMGYLLEAFGHEALMAEDGERGLAMARLETPDLILCDVQLPKRSGYEVSRELKHDPVLCHIPLVAVTALSSIDCGNVLMDTFDYILVKPIVPEKLALQLTSFLARGPVQRRSAC